MKILVTGGAGFIGSHVVDSYIGMGHKVVVIDDLSTGKRGFVNSKARFYQADIRDASQIEHIMSSEKPEILNHHAAQMDVRKSVADPCLDAQINIIGLLNLLESGKANGLKKVIFASSGGTVYGDTEILPTPESALTHPKSPYGISKLTSEHYLYFYNNTYNISYAILRYGNVYGPRQNPHGEAGVVAIFTKKLLVEEAPTINGDGKQSRDFVYVGDVVEANNKVIDLSKSVILNIGTGKAATVNTVFNKLLEITQSKVTPVYGPEKPGEQLTSILDIKAAAKTIGWQPKKTLEDGLRRTVDFFKNEKN